MTVQNKSANHINSRFISTLIAIGSSSPLNPEERRKRISATFILLTTIITTCIFFLYHLYNRHYSIVALDGIGFFASLILLLYLRKREEMTLVSWMIGICFVFLCCITTILGREEISLFFWAFALPAGCFSVMGDKKGIVFSLSFFFLNIILMILPEQFLPSKPYSSYIVVRYSIIYIILTFIIYFYESSQQMLIRHIQQEKDKFENASKHDLLTGLSNRRDIIEKMEDERERYLRLSKPFTLIIGDIDNFKQLNDSFGHDSGDYVLKIIGRILKNQVRGIDCPSRWGGEEFLIMLVETDLDGGQRVAERIRKKIEKTSFKYKNTLLPVTMTFGLSIYQSTEDNIDACIKRADKCLYEGKYQGKNRVVAV